jgi:hypothetical protein
MRLPGQRERPSWKKSRRKETRLSGPCMALLYDRRRTRGPGVPIPRFEDFDWSTAC